MTNNINSNQNFGFGGNNYQAAIALPKEIELYRLESDDGERIGYYCQGWHNTVLVAEAINQEFDCELEDNPVQPQDFTKAFLRKVPANDAENLDFYICESAISRQGAFAATYVIF